MPLQLADDLLLVGGQRLELVAQCAQFGGGDASPSPDGHQLTVVDVAQPRRSDVGTHLCAGIERVPFAAAERDRDADDQPSRWTGSA